MGFEKKGKTYTTVQHNIMVHSLIVTGVPNRIHKILQYHIRTAGGIESVISRRPHKHKYISKVINCIGLRRCTLVGKIVKYKIRTTARLR